MEGILGAILKMLDGLLKFRCYELRTISFDEFRLAFENGPYVKVTKSNSSRKDNGAVFITLKFRAPTSLPRVHPPDSHGRNDFILDRHRPSRLQFACMKGIHLPLPFPVEKGILSPFPIFTVFPIGRRIPSLILLSFLNNDGGRGDSARAVNGPLFKIGRLFCP